MARGARQPLELGSCEEAAGLRSRLYRGDAGLHYLSPWQEQATSSPEARDVRNTVPFELVTIDTMGPITPQALGGYSSALKLVDQLTKWKEAILVKDNTQTVEALATQQEPRDSRRRLIRVEGDMTRSPRVRLFDSIVPTSALSWSLLLPTLLSRSERTSEQVGRLSTSLRCLLADSGLPKFLWGDLTHTAVYLSKRSPHAALNNGTPFKALRQGCSLRECSGDRG